MANPEVGAGLRTITHAGRIKASKTSTQFCSLFPKEISVFLGKFKIETKQRCKQKSEAQKGKILYHILINNSNDGKSRKILEVSGTFEKRKNKIMINHPMDWSTPEIITQI